MSWLCKLLPWLCKPQPPTPPPAPPAIVVHLSVWFDGDLTTAPDAHLTLDQFSARVFVGVPTDEDRYAFTLPADTVLTWGATLALSGTPTTRPYAGRCVVALDIADVELAPAAPPRRSQAQMLDVRANFCNLRDSQQRVIFTADLMGLTAPERMNWYERLREAGSTHVVFSPTGGSYPGSPIPPFDYYGDPVAVADMVQEILRQPGADGLAMTPVLFLDGGDRGFPDRMQAYWAPIHAAIGPADEPDVIVCPGWELVNASSVTSKQYSDALQLLHAQGWTHIWAHLSPGRAACSSNPIEPDDPWQGGESDCWKTYGGQFVEGLFYQSEATRTPDDTIPEHTGWLDRWDDVVPRIVNGLNGWRRMRLCFFESGAYYYYRGQNTDAFCRRIATRARNAAALYNATVGYGNGLPE